jgi:hypothetical protein
MKRKRYFLSGKYGAISGDDEDNGGDDNNNHYNYYNFRCILADKSVSALFDVALLTL